MTMAAVARLSRLFGSIGCGTKRIFTTNTSNFLATGIASVFFNNSFQLTFYFCHSNGYEFFGTTGTTFPYLLWIYLFMFGFWCSAVVWLWIVCICLNILGSVRGTADWLKTADVDFGVMGIFAFCWRIKLIMHENN